MKENYGTYCKKCVMKDSYPGITINEEGLCNLCASSLDISVKNYREALKNYKDFIKNIFLYENPYDCLLMFSGGKDSYYLLYKFITEEHIKPLVFTVKHPFESEIAQNNVKIAREKINFDHIHFSPNIEAYKEIMCKAFSYKRDSNNEKMFDERIPCTTCGYISQIFSFIFAYKMNIKYIVYANDPSQIIGIFYDIKDDIKNLINICGAKLFYKMFDKKIIEQIMNTDYEELPKFVTPYVAEMREYDANNIIKELKRNGLYIGDNVQTYCSLVSLLNYYSYKNYNCPFFAHQISQSIRQGKLSRETMIEILDKYKEIIMDISIKEDIDEHDINNIRYFLKQKYGEHQKEKIEYELENIINMRMIASKLNLEIE